MTAPHQTRPVVIILGPTAGGKTALSVALAKALPGGGECISADSMQVYRGMDIGTATPTAQERAGVEHHLMDVVDPDHPWTVEDWHARAQQVVDEIRRRGHWPVLVGGTNLYVQTFLTGLVEATGPDPAIRARLETLDAPELRKRLERDDPTSADRIHPNDRRRTIRALEVLEVTGVPLSAQQTHWAGPIRPDVVMIGLEWSVSEINARINRRVKHMVHAGLLEEVRGLLEARGLGPQAREALGYAQIIDHLEGRSTLEEAIEQIKIKTRRFAKQQRTWLRRFRAIEGITWIEAREDSMQLLAPQAIAAILESDHAHP